MQADAPDVRSRMLERAVALFTTAVAACRAQDVPYMTRLECEPKAWLELGLCYSAMGLWYEASFAFEAVVRCFSQEHVSRALARMPEFRWDLAAVDDELRAAGLPRWTEETVGRREAMLYRRVAANPRYKGVIELAEARRLKCATNLVVATRRRAAESGLSFDRDRYDEAIRMMIHVNPCMDPVSDFHRAAAVNTEADARHRRGENEAAARAWIEAADLFVKSAGTMASVRETSLYMAGSRYYKAMAETKNMAASAPELFRQTGLLGRKALAAFESFEREAANAPDDPPRALRLKEAQIAEQEIRVWLDALDKKEQGPGYDAAE
jgi:tetratricopeptide (TPR) repeat protein